MATIKIIAHGANDDNTAPSSLKFRVYNGSNDTQIGSDLTVGGDVTVATDTPTAGSYQVTIDNFDAGTLGVGDSIKVSAVDADGDESTLSNSKSIVNSTPTYILDTYTDAAGAYSLRKLKTGATKSVEIRRSSDDAITDVLLEDSGFISLTSTVSAGGSLSSWIGSNTAYISKWYDQTGNSKDAVQTNTSYQPILVNAGVLVADNGLLFDGVNDRLDVPSIISLFTGEDKPMSVFAVARKEATNTLRTLIGLGNSSSDTPLIKPIILTEAGFYRIQLRDDAGTLLTGTSTVNYTANKELITNINSGLASEIFSNGVSKVSLVNDLTAITLDLFTIGAMVRTSPGEFWMDTISEVIIFNSDQSSNRVGIESDINNAHLIY